MGEQKNAEDAKEEEDKGFYHEVREERRGGQES